MQLLKQLTEASGPPGYEKEIREIAIRELRPLCDDVRIDAMGNVIGFKKGTLPDGQRKKIMLAGHMDEIGFYVRWVDDQGFLRLNPAGGFDPKTLIAKRVIVHGKSGAKHIGMVGTKPVHIMTDEEKAKMPKVEDLFVDLGMPADAVKAEFEIGSPVTLYQTFMEKGDTATCKAMDNRTSIWTMIRALQHCPRRGRGSGCDREVVRGEARHWHCDRHHPCLRHAWRAATGCDLEAW